MGTVLIHAGTAKAGSTAIQEFLRHNSSQLASRNVTIAVASCLRPGSPPVVVHKFDGGRVNSGQAVRLMLDRPETTTAVMRALVDRLERLARDSETVVLTAEGLAQLIWRADAIVLRALDDLAAARPVRVAYYVRPQHTALEAAWRQWGFRDGIRPAAYFKLRAAQLHYFETSAAMRTIAPRLDFSIRPFHPELLDSGDVVVDFAQRFLGLAEGVVQPSSEHFANVGLSLEIVNLLSTAPRDFLGPTPHHHRRFDMAKELLSGFDAPLSQDALRGTELLQGWCHAHFEPSNQQLMQRLGWSIDAFVPSTGELVNALDPLDVLWSPSASPAEIAAFLRLLELHFSSMER